MTLLKGLPRKLLIATFATFSLWFVCALLAIGYEDGVDIRSQDNSKMKLLILITALSFSACCSPKADALPLLDLGAMRQVHLPFGASILTEPALQADPETLGDSVLIIGQYFSMAALDSLLNTDAAYQGGLLGSKQQGLGTNVVLYEQLRRSTTEMIDQSIPGFSEYRKSTDLVANFFFVLGKDTIVYLDSHIEADYRQIGETVYYLDYTLAATVKNGQMLDFLPLSYHAAQMYAAPERHFYIHGDSINIADFVFGEENRMRSSETWTVENGRFLKR